MAALWLLAPLPAAATPARAPPLAAGWRRVGRSGRTSACSSHPAASMPPYTCPKPARRDHQGEEEWARKPRGCGAVPPQTSQVLTTAGSIALAGARACWPCAPAAAGTCSRPGKQHRSRSAPLPAAPLPRFLPRDLAAGRQLQQQLALPRRQAAAVAAAPPQAERAAWLAAVAQALQGAPPALAPRGQARLPAQQQAQQAPRAPVRLLPEGPALPLQGSALLALLPPRSVLLVTQPRGQALQGQARKQAALPPCPGEAALAPLRGRVLQAPSRRPASLARAAPPTVLT